MNYLKAPVFKSLFLIFAFFAAMSCATTAKANSAATIEVAIQAVPPIRTVELPENPLTAFIAELSNEDLVTQLFVVRMDQLQEAEGLQAGGIIFFASDIPTIGVLETNIARLQAEVDIPLFMAIDEEGGTVSRLKRFYPEVLSISPSSLKNAAPETIETHSQHIGAILKNVGINVNFAPVVDVLDQQDNALLKHRSFGSDPNLVDSLSTAFLQGLENESVMGVYKHFPGHGAVNADSHHGKAVITLPFEEFASRHLPPYQNRPMQLNGIMVAHITLQEISDKPATLSKEITEDLLRRKLGYLGLVFTDAMNMGAITEYYDSGQAAVQALEAGADIVLIPEDFPAAYKAVLAAVNEGQIDRSRLEESAYRILYAKQLYCGLELK